MEKNNPMARSNAEWEEIMQVREVREGWGLQADETVKTFTPMVYGVKFAFVSGGPGYCGDLYIIQGDALGEPMSLIRQGSTLKAV